MPGYSDEPPVSRSADHRHERRSPRDHDGYDDDFYRRHRRRNTYDASDEDDYVPHRRHRSDHQSANESAHGLPDIPPPPIGEERKKALPVRAAEPVGAHDAYADTAVPHEERRRHRKSERHAHDEAEEAGEGDDRKHTSKSSRHVDPEMSFHGDKATTPPLDRTHAKGVRSPYDDPNLYDEDPPIVSERRHRKSRRSPYDAEPEAAPVVRKPSRRHRDDFGDGEPPRRFKAHDTYDEPPRRKDPYADPHRRRDRHPVHSPEDSDDYDAPPRRRHEKPRRAYEDGYGTDRPRHAARDDPHERGYRTDGRDARRERDRHHADRRDPRREDRRRDDRHHDDYDDSRDTRRDHRPRPAKHGGFDVDNIVQKGQKNWQKVAPVAKPLLAQLAHTYLNNGKPGGGVPH